MYSRDSRAKLTRLSESSAWGVEEVVPITEINPLTSRGRALGQGMDIMPSRKDRKGTELTASKVTGEPAADKPPPDPPREGDEAARDQADRLFFVDGVSQGEAEHLLAADGRPIGEEVEDTPAGVGAGGFPWGGQVKGKQARGEARRAPAAATGWFPSATKAGRWAGRHHEAPGIHRNHRAEGDPGGVGAPGEDRRQAPFPTSQRPDGCGVPPFPPARGPNAGRSSARAGRGLLAKSTASGGENRVLSREMVYVKAHRGSQTQRD